MGKSRNNGSRPELISLKAFLQTIKVITSASTATDGYPLTKSPLITLFPAQERLISDLIPPTSYSPVVGVIKKRGLGMSMFNEIVRKNQLI